MFDIIKDVLKRFWAIGWKWIGGPLIAGILGIMVIGRAVDWYAGPKSYNVYLVGDFSDSNLQKLRQAYEAEQKTSLKIAGVDLHFISLDAKEKDAAKISAKLAKQNDTLFVIGHHSSTASANALPNYLNADPPIPVILANETNPELLPPDYRINYAPVFRLSPTDNKQAETAAHFMVDQDIKNIWVVEDVVVNPVYSRYLAQEFVRQVDAKSQLHERRQVFEKRQVSEKRQVYENSSKVLLWTTNLELPSVDVVQAMRIDGVFFVGSSSNCLILNRQVKEIWKDKPKKPKVLLSSSCADMEVLQQGVEDIKEAFLTHPMLASDFTNGGFEIRGVQAFQLLQQLITGADYDFSELSSKHGGISYYVNWVFGFHRVADARNALRAFMEQAVYLEEGFLLGKQRYTFNRDGTGKEAAFHVWRVQTPSNKIGFTEIENY